MDQHLAGPFLRCLRAEEELLAESRTVADVVYAALRGGDLAAVTAAVSRQQALADAMAEAGTARTAAAVALAHSVGLPDNGLTLNLLAANVPAPFAADVLAARERLTALTAELGALQTRNANLLGHLRSFFRGVLSDLAPADAPARYGPSGGRLTPPGGALQTRG